MVQIIPDAQDQCDEAVPSCECTHESHGPTEGCCEVGEHIVNVRTMPPARQDGMNIICTACLEHTNEPAPHPDDAEEARNAFCECEDASHGDGCEHAFDGRIVTQHDGPYRVCEVCRVAGHMRPEMSEHALRCESIANALDYLDDYMDGDDPDGDPILAAARAALERLKAYKEVTW